MIRKIFIVATILFLIFANYILISNLRGISDNVRVSDKSEDVTMPREVVDEKVILIAQGEQDSNCFDLLSGHYIDKSTESSHPLIYKNGFIVHVDPEYSFYVDMPYGKDPRGGTDFIVWPTETLKIKPTVGMEFGAEVGRRSVSVCRILSVTDKQVEFLCSTYKD